MVPTHVERCLPVPDNQQGTGEKLQVLLDETGAEVDVDLYQWRLANSLEAVDLTGLDDKDVSSAALECLAIDRPHPAALPDELDFVIRMPMRARSRTGLAIEEEHRNTCVSCSAPTNSYELPTKGRFS